MAQMRFVQPLHMVPVKYHQGLRPVYARSSEDAPTAAARTRPVTGPCGQTTGLFDAKSRFFGTERSDANRTGRNWP